MPTIADSGYYPHLWELLVMCGISGMVLLAGRLIQRKVAGPGMPLPLPLALVMFFGMFLVFCTMVRVFATATPLQDRITLEAGARDAFDIARAQAGVIVDRRMPVMFFSILIYLWPMAFYINLLRNAYATGMVDRIGPFSARIEDPSEFASARKLALRGDVDGAVQVYRNYRENTCEALFEAARLLKAEDRFAEAAAVFQEITEKFYERRPAWADATYQLAKIHEQNLFDINNALELYRSIIKRTPESRYAALAGHEVARLQSGPDVHEATELVEMPEQGAEKDPFFGRGRAVAVKPAPVSALAPVNGAGGEEVVLPIPEQDPFFAVRAKQSKLVAAAEGAAVKPSAKKAAAKAASKKPAAKKAPAKPAAKVAAPKVAATKKPAAKKPAAKKSPQR